MVSVAIGDPLFRAVLAVLSITPLLYVTIRLALAAQRADAPSGLDSQIEQVLQQMHDLVEWLGKAAGKESGPGPDRPGSLEPGGLRPL